MSWPPASVIVPFRGDAGQAARLVESLKALELGVDDEVIVVDNSKEGCVSEARAVSVVRATRERSSYYARNAGARAAGLHDQGNAAPARSLAEGRKSPIGSAHSFPRGAEARWLVFTDADCVPVPWLIAGYFAEPVAADVGALAGSVVSDPSQRHFLARYATNRGFLDQEAGVHTAEDAAATANLAVRRSAFEEIGGFEEGIRSAGDVDFCRRLNAAGWRIERRPAAVVTHLHRESLFDLMDAIARYASGARWLNERYPGSAPQWGLIPGMVNCARDIAGELAQRRFEQAAFRGVDALGLVAHTIGYRRSNAAS